MAKENNKKIWSLWGIGLGLIYAIVSIIIYNISLSEAFGMVLGAWIMAMLCYAMYSFLYVRKELNPNKKPIWRIIKSILLVWILILVFIFSLPVLISFFQG